MKLRIDTRIYTNLVLTVIAAVLVASAVQNYGVNLTQNAQAQKIRNPADNDLARSATGVPIDTTIPQTQDVAVAAATSQVAAANREIAVALHEVAAAIREGMDGLGSTLRTVNSTSSASSAIPAASGSSSSSSGPKPTVEVN